MYRLLSPFLLILLVLGLPLSGSVLHAHAAAAPQVVLSSDVASASGGSVLSVSGSGFTSGSTVTIAFDATPIGAAPVSGQGSFGPVQVTVPGSVPGQHLIKATGSGTPQVGATQTVYLAKLTASSATGPVGSSVTISAQGLPANQPVTLKLGGQIIPLSQAVTDSNGNLTATFTVPNVSPGSLPLQILVGNAQAVLFSSTFTVIQATLTVNPTTVVQGGSVQVSASGLPTNTPLTVQLDTTALTSIVSTNGSQTATITVPASTSVGTHQVRLLQGSQVVATAALIVSAAAHAAISLAPATGPIGSHVTVTGTGFQPGEQVQLTLNGVALTTTLASAQGLITVSVLLPQTFTNGSASILATGMTSHSTATASFTLAAGLTVNPTTVVAGGTVTVIARGFQPGEPVQIMLAGAEVGRGTADTTGTATIPVTIAVTMAQGTGTLTATGQISHRTATATLTVTANAHISVNTGSTIAGSAIIVSGTGFAPGEVVALTIPGAAVSPITANTQGAFTVSITVPSGQQAGAVTLSATGQSSHRTATATLAVTARQAAQLTITPDSGTPGTTVRIAGTGFGVRESVQVRTSSGTVLATALTGSQGAFVITVTLPASGPATALQIIAVGSTSKITASNTVRITTPVPPVTGAVGSATWYFAAGRTDSGYSEQIAVLNPGTSVVHGTVTFYYGVNETKVSQFTLAAHARGTYDAGQIVGAQRQVAAFVQADAPVAAARTTQRGSMDRMASNGVRQPSRTWYMAEGYTSLTFQESLALFNPGVQPAHVHIVWPLFNGRPAVTQDVTLAPRSRQTIDVNTFVTKASHATLVTSDQPMVAARTILFGARGQGADSKPGVTTPSTDITFAEGSTANGFEEYLTILNPSTTATAHVTFNFYNRSGQQLGTRTISVDPMHRGNLKVNDVAHDAAIATIIHSDQPIVAERSMYFGAPNGSTAGGTVVLGQSTPARGWAFATGDTQSASEFELLFNPNNTASTVLATFYADSGQVVQQTFTVNAHSRLNIDLNVSVPGLPHGTHGLVLTTTNGVPFFAEQAIYTNNIGNGSASIGTPIQ